MNMSTETRVVVTNGMVADIVASLPHKYGQWFPGDVNAAILDVATDGVHSEMPFYSTDAEWTAYLAAVEATRQYMATRS